MIIRICGTLTLYLCFVLFVLFCVRFRFVCIAFCVLVIFDLSCKIDLQNNVTCEIEFKS